MKKFNSEKRAVESVNKLLTESELRGAVGARAKNSIQSAANALRRFDTASGKSTKETNSRHLSPNPRQ